MSYVLGIGGVWSGTFTADGGGTSFSIPHGLVPQPDYAVVVPASSNAAHNAGVALTFHVSIDSTNIVVNYNAATVSGTDNIVLIWMAGRAYSIREEIFAVTRDDIGDDDTA